MFRRVAMLAATLIFLATATVSAATTTITITTFAYPANTSVGLGDTVLFENHTTVHHTSTSNSPLSIWNIDMNGNGTSGSKLFFAAGTFAFHCMVHPSEMHGNIVVPMKAAPTTGTTATTFVIRWATIKAPAGFKYVVQRRAPGGAFTTFKSTINKSASWAPSKAGSWTFRARFVRLSNGAKSGFSPTLSVVVH
jgi:plastocyanin